MAKGLCRPSVRHGHLTIVNAGPHILEGAPRPSLGNHLETHTRQCDEFQLTITFVGKIPRDSEELERASGYPTRDDYALVK